MTLKLQFLVCHLFQHENIFPGIFMLKTIQQEDNSRSSLQALEEVFYHLLNNILYLLRVICQSDGLIWIKLVSPLRFALVGCDNRKNKTTQVLTGGSCCESGNRFLYAKECYLFPPYVIVNGFLSKSWKPNSFIFRLPKKGLSSCSTHYRYRPRNNVLNSQKSTFAHPGCAHKNLYQRITNWLLLWICFAILLLTFAAAPEINQQIGKSTCVDF